MKMVPNIGDLYKIAIFLKENEYNEIPLEVIIPVYTRERLAKLNREFRFNKNMNTVDESEADYVDEINISIEGINFKYRLTELPEPVAEKIEDFSNVGQENNI